MGDKTGISWTDATWNPTSGCDRVSDGCDHCYALTMAKRLKAMGQTDYQRDGDPRTSGPGFGLTIRPHMLDQPLRWRRPRRIFVNSMSDVFHEEVPDAYIGAIFDVMARSPHHIFQVLTKRHGRMRSLLRRWAREGIRIDGGYLTPPYRPLGTIQRTAPLWTPPPNVWLGVSVEDQRWADIRVPALLETPAAVRFLSCEPLLGPLNLIGQGGNLHGAGIHALPDPPDRDDGEPVCQQHGIERCWQGCTFVDWVIVGGESGPGARPMDPDWVRGLRDECVAAGVAFHFKQWGEYLPADDARARGLGGPEEVLYSGRVARRVGKKIAGRDLDGRTWDEWPTAAEAAPA